MPNRQTHQLLTIVSAAVAAPAIAFIPLDAFIAAEVGILMTLLPELTPDLDVSTRKFSALQELIGLKAYAQLVPHRYGTGRKHWTRLRIWNIFFFSHIPFIGTALRTLLCTLPLVIIFMVLGVSSEAVWSSAGYYLLWLWAGMGWSDCWHVGADLIVSDFKETRREFWYGKKSEQRKVYRKTWRV